MGRATRDFLSKLTLAYKCATCTAIARQGERFSGSDHDFLPGNRRENTFGQQARLVHAPCDTYTQIRKRVSLRACPRSAYGVHKVCAWCARAVRSWRACRSSLDSCSAKMVAWPLALMTCARRQARCGRRRDAKDCCWHHVPSVRRWLAHGCGMQAQREGSAPTAAPGREQHILQPSLSAG